MKKAALSLLIAGSTVTFSASADQSFVGCISAINYDKSDDLKGGSLAQGLTQIPGVANEVTQQDGIVIQKNYRILPCLAFYICYEFCFSEDVKTWLKAIDQEQF